MPKKRKKTKKDNSSITRRDMLKGAGAAAVMGPIMLTSRKAFGFQDPLPTDGGEISAPVAEPVVCDFGVTSPPTRPFIDALPVPATASKTTLFPRPTQNANISGGEAARAPHQRWGEFLPEAEYSIQGRPSTHRFHSDYLPTYIWGWNGIYPGPTIRNNYGDPVIVRFKNDLPDNSPHFGLNEITVHLHNGHTASESDGFAGDFFGKGLFKDNHYVNAYAGIDTFGTTNGVRGDPREAMHTFWYHDHRAAFTFSNNGLGLNGMYILYDRTDPGHENAANGSLRLPGIYGVTDIPLILAEKRFCQTDPARGRTEQVIDFGDKWSVNGKIQPKMSVRRRKYRFRILNTGPAKNFSLKLVKSNGSQASWTIVAADANFLRDPWELSNGNLPIFVASRYDVIIDFKQFPVGSKVYIREDEPQNVGVPTPDPAPGLPIENVLMRFDVVGEATIPDTPPIPNTLVELPPLPTPTDCFQWRFTLEFPSQRPDAEFEAFLVNELEFDKNRVDWVVLKGSCEEWELKNDVIASDWVHPVHIHFEEGRVIQRTRRVDVGLPTERRVNVTLKPDEDFRNARRDVYPLQEENAVKLRMQFRDFSGRYLIHCHNMGHEDGFMMVRWDIVSSRTELEARRRDIFEFRRAKGLPIVPCGQNREP
jgi:FtsP/CotA-like multicopper oxidase with cupredoxin domain